MRYVMARISAERNEQAYRIYLSEGIKIIGENTAGIAKEGKALNKSYKDILFPPKEETRSTDEIKNNILSKLGNGKE